MVISAVSSTIPHRPAPPAPPGAPPAPEGRGCALAGAREGADLGTAAKTGVAETPRLPGTIHDVAREVEALGRRALAIKLDVRDADACDAAIAQAADKFGRIDALVNNAGAL